MSLRLSPPDSSHAKEWHDWRQDPEARRYNPFAPSSVDSLRDRLSQASSNLGLFENRENFIWLIRESEEVVGNLSLQNVNRAMLTAEIGYMVGPKSRGRGIATQAVSLLVNHCFKQSPLRKLIAFVHEENISSRKVLEKVGFQEEGLLREHFLIEGKPANEVLYGILSRNFQPLI